MLKKNLKKIEYQALIDFKKSLIHRFTEDVLSLKLFGSKARGDSKKDSDIDILIIFKSFSKEKEDFIIDLTVQLLFKYGVNISPHIYAQSEILRLKKIPSIFFQILEREAISL